MVAFGAFDVQPVGGPHEHVASSSSTAGAAQPSLSEADVGGHAQALGQHDASQTDDMDPAELLLEHVFRFWKRIGYSLSDVITGVEVDRPSNDMEQFLQETLMVQLALKVWLRDGADLPASAAVVPMLALWFRDPECPDLDGDEENNFLAQWRAYVIWRRKRRG
jgi:hypothetical protein